ncbi:hypothetical protein L7F22_026326 [Adiantum nelumboides]|nr:hypothetical protein [Adiantum nelumboides]
MVPLPGKSLFPIEVNLGQFGLEDAGDYNSDTGIAIMADRNDDVTEEVSSSQGQQTHEVGESSRPPQTENEIFRTQLVTAVAMFTQVMQNPRFMAFLQPLPPSQSIGNKKSEPAKAQPQHALNPDFLCCLHSAGLKQPQCTKTIAAALEGDTGDQDASSASHSGRADCSDLCHKSPVIKEYEWSAHLARSPGSPTKARKCEKACVRGCAFKFNVTASELASAIPRKPEPSTPPPPAPSQKHAGPVSVKASDEPPAMSA